MDAVAKGAFVRMASGELVQRDALDIATRINEYDHNLRLKYLPPEEQQLTDAPFAVFEMCPDGLERLIFYVWELDARVLDRIRLADTGSNDILARIDAVNGKIRSEKARRYADQLGEKHDIFKHAFADSGQTYSYKDEMGNIKTIDEDAKGGLRVEPGRTKSQSPNINR